MSQKTIDQVNSNSTFKKIKALHGKWLNQLSCTPTAAHHGSQNFYNWSGWEAASPTPNHSWYVTAGMDWTVPRAVYPPASEPTDVSIWPGVGQGTASWDQLVQAGTVSNSGPGFAGIGNYSGQGAWFELYPAENEQAIDQFGDIAAGTHVSVLATMDVGTNTADWLVCVGSTCLSISQALGAVNAFALPSSAEWIVERDSLNNNFTALAPFSNGTITGAMGSQELSSGSGSEGFTPGSANMPTSALTNLTMIGCNGSTLATTGPISTAGAFTVTWVARGHSEHC